VHHCFEGATLIPLKLETLLSGRVVEQDRVEYKKGWNPNEVIRTVCAFANDYSNTNGGYIVLGIDQENGRPVLPPVGIEEDDLDAAQQNLFRCCNAPGPDKKIDMAKFAQGKPIAVRYRNRRIGEFLQEIQLSEKKSTDITKVFNALRINGSPAPLFETDQERETFFATVYLHEGFEPITRENGDDSDRNDDETLISADGALIDADRKLIERTQAILDYINSNSGTANRNAQELPGLKDDAVRKIFSQMIETGLIEAVGETDTVLIDGQQNSAFDGSCIC
jgi:ATP-dependent DNA helicase RecG